MVVESQYGLEIAAWLPQEKEANECCCYVALRRKDIGLLFRQTQDNLASVFVYTMATTQVIAQDEVSIWEEGWAMDSFLLHLSKSFSYC